MLGMHDFLSDVRLAIFDYKFFASTFLTDDMYIALLILR